MKNDGTANKQHDDIYAAAKSEENSRFPDHQDPPIKGIVAIMVRWMKFVTVFRPFFAPCDLVLSPPQLYDSILRKSRNKQLGPRGK